MRLFRVISFLVILGVAIAGCNQVDNPVLTNDPSPAVVLAPSATSSVSLAGYLVQFDGRSYDGSQTTFSYTVSGVDPPHALSNFFLEVPDCAPDPNAFDPSGPALNVNPHNGIYGAMWTIGLGMNESRSYSMTFPGDVPLGIIRSHVKAGTTVDIGTIAGPCAGFVISGAVYVDADSSGTRSAAELGIDNVTVRLVDAAGDIESMPTDSNGDYIFVGLDGTYTVRVDAATPEIDFNEELANSFDPTGLTSFEVTVGPDSPYNNFGYHPRQDEIIAELEAGTLPTDGENAKYWTKQVRGKGNVDYSAMQVSDFITEIQGLFLVYPFQFTPGNESAEVMDILSIRSKDDLELLKRELLTAEFNHVSGKGLGDPALQAALLKWVEALVVEAGSSLAGTSSTLKQGDAPAAAAGNHAGVRDALNMLLLLNGATGGGSGGGG